MSAERRLEAARALTASQDAKASAVLSAAGLLLTAGGVLVALNRPHGAGAALAALSGLALVAAALELLAVLHPRGGSPAAWLLIDQEPVAEVAKVARIAGLKHRYLNLAIWSLAASVGFAVLAAAATVAGAS